MTLKFKISFIFLFLVNCIFAQLTPEKKDAIKTIDNISSQLFNLSDEIWEYAELALKENKSSQALMNFAEKNGFKVTKGVAEMPTAFIAEYGSGKPIIGILGEFDALPGLSQKTVPYRSELVKNGNGHGCGHNMFGVGSLGAAIAVKDLIQKGVLKGTIRFYGTPAEEDKGGKVYMARAGLFNDLDVCLDWHPATSIKVNRQTYQAVVDYDIVFKGKSAHAASDPWNGRSALDAAELFNVGINFLREHIKPSVRIHYVYKDAGGVPNVIPNKAIVWLWIRDNKYAGVKVVEERLFDIAKGAALMAGVDYEVNIKNGAYELILNDIGAQTMQQNLNLLGNIEYTDAELKFADTMMRSANQDFQGIDGKVHPLEAEKEIPDGGSTDVGDVSYNVPVITLNATTAPAGASWHSWIFVACGGMSIGHKGLQYASKTLALTMIDLFENATLRTQIRQEFEKRKGQQVWKAVLPPGPPPFD